MSEVVWKGGCSLPLSLSLKARPLPPFHRTWQVPFGAARFSPNLSPFLDLSCRSCQLAPRADLLLRSRSSLLMAPAKMS